MRVLRWGNDLIVRLPASIVEQLGLREGDDIVVRMAGKRMSDVHRPSVDVDEALAEIPRQIAF